MEIPQINLTLKVIRTVKVPQASCTLSARLLYCCSVFLNSLPLTVSLPYQTFSHCQSTISNILSLLLQYSPSLISPIQDQLLLKVFKIILFYFLLTLYNTIPFGNVMSPMKIKEQSIATL